MRNIAAANEILSRFEDILIDGEVVQGVSASGVNTSARIKRLGEHMLLLVADYSTYQPSRSEVVVNLPQSLADNFIDIETGEHLVPDSTGMNFAVTLSVRRARLFYGGPGWKH